MEVGGWWEEVEVELDESRKSSLRIEERLGYALRKWAGKKKVFKVEDIGLSFGRRMMLVAAARCCQCPPAQL